MCGIISYISQKPTLSEKCFLEACNTLHHRGPDNTTAWISQNREVYLGHTRLSIIDLETGTQPITNVDRNIVIIVNGEFYNHDAIRKDFIQEGYQFLTKSDSEILIPLYQKYGKDCIRHLNGEFAFILYDLKENIVMAGRDRFGIKPLHYSIEKGEIFFASEAKAILKMGVPASLDILSCVRHYNLLPSNSQSVFDKIKMVKPGHFMLISLKNLEIKEHKYWDISYPTASSLSAKIDEKEYIAEFRRLLENSVKLRLRSDQPVGCYLSGGLDSSAVIGVMAAMSNRPVEAFTIAFEDPQYNEGDIAIDTSKFVGSNQHILTVTDQLLVENFEDSIYHAEQPVFNSHGTAKYLLSKKARDSGVRVILTGEGSDELLAGYIAFKIDNLTLSNAADKDEILKTFLSNNPTSAGLFFSKDQADHSENLEYFRSKLGFIPQNLRVSEGSNMQFYNLLKQEHVESLKISNPVKSIFDEIYHPLLQGVEPLNKSLYLWSKSALPGYILTVLGDRMEMAHSIEGRPPFFDKNLVEFILKLPVEMKINRWREKYILREAAKDLITPNLYKREKFPYLAPVARSRKDLFYLYMQEVFNGELLKNSNIFDAKKVLAQFNQFENLSPSDQTSNNSRFLQILSTLILEKKFTS